MEILVMSSSSHVATEVDDVVQMFDLGLRYFHVNKPKMSRRELSNYLKSYPDEYRGRLILHSYHSLADQFKLGGIHLSRRHRKRKWIYRTRLWLKRKLYPGMVVTRTFHKLTDLSADKRTYSYTFLSPVFDSVSQNSLGGGYSRRALLIMIPQAKQPIYALGGVHPGNIAEVASLGFQGAILLGSLWNGDDKPAHIFAAALEEARKTGI